MTTIVTRAGKGSPLTNNEVDANFTNLNTAKVEVSGTPTNGQVISWNGATSTWVPITAGSSSGTVSSVDVSGALTGLTFTGGPVTTSGTITLGGTLAVGYGGTGAATAAGARANLGAAASGANSDITSMSGITGSLGTPTYIQFDSGAGTTLAAGRLWYDQVTGSMNVGMGNGNITQQIGEELFYYGKATAAINDSPLQIIYQTGTVGASGTITFAPTASGITDGNLIIGCATEPIALNAFGRITTFGTIHGITTNGTAYGETWVDGDTIWYNPATGNPTNIKPVAPNIKVSVGTIIKAGSGGSGSFQVEVNHGSVLGGTDSNVQLTSTSDGQLLQYYGAGGYWRNVAATSVAVTSFSGGTTGLTPASATVGAVTLGGTLAVANGGTGVTTSTGSGSVVLSTSPTLVTPNLGTPSSGTLTNVTGLPLTTGVTGTLGVANGGTGATSLMANNVILGNGTSAVQVVAPGASGNVLQSNGTTWVSSTPPASGISQAKVTGLNFIFGL